MSLTPAHVTHRQVLAGGVDWHVAVAGHGPPLLLLHGWPEFWLVWERLIDHLADRYTLYIPDLPGFGETPDPNGGRPSDSLGADALADGITVLLAELGVAKVGMVTHDVGAYVGQSLGLRRPSLLSGLFLFDCPTPFVGVRWRDADHIGEIWYQTFNQQPWAAELVGSSAANCRLYIGSMLRHWAMRPDAFSERDLDRWVAAYMRPGNLQGGFNWYRAASAA
jgi:epoxide hydrolase 4